jgi:hypothetical protein
VMTSFSDVNVGILEYHYSTFGKPNREDVVEH